jgi:hypothetical protein
MRSSSRSAPLHRGAPLRALLASAATAIGLPAQVALSVDRLDGSDPGGPAPAHLVVVDVHADVAATDTWVAGGLRAVASSGAALRYGPGAALVNPGLADRFVTCVSRPMARDADSRFGAALVGTTGGYDPSAPSPTATATEVNIAWFASPPANSGSPSVDGHVARVVIDLAAVVGIDPATIEVTAGAPPPGRVPLLVSEPSAGSSTAAGTVAATFDVPSVSGLDWSIHAEAVPAIVLRPDRLGAADPGGPPPAGLVVVDLHADIGPTDTWVAAGLRAVARNGAALRYGPGAALVNPGLADRFVTCVSRPMARDADSRFDAALVGTTGGYDPSAPAPTATATEVNIAWFASPPANSGSPSVDGYIARIALDLGAVEGIDPRSVAVAGGLPPRGSVPLLVSSPAPNSTATGGWVGATFDAQSPTGIDWSVYAWPCAAYAGSADPRSGTCDPVPLGPPTTTVLTTQFGPSLRAAVGGAVYFELSATELLHLNGLLLNTDAPLGTRLEVQVFRTALGATHTGNETDPSRWIPETTGTGIAAGLDRPSAVELGRPLRVEAGRYGIALVARTFAHRASTGAATFSDGTLTVRTGTASDLPFAAPLASPRTANLSLRYQRAADRYTNQRYQTILRAADLGAGPITGLAFAACADGWHWSDSLQIQMAHVRPGHRMSPTFAANLPSPITVLDARDRLWVLTGDTWNELGLQRAFPYDGVSDVVVDIVVRGNVHDGGAGFHADAAVPRAAAFGWSRSVPTTASGPDSALDELGLRLRAQQGCADAARFGWSCGRLRAGHAGLPRLGAAFAFTCEGAPAGGPAFLCIGLDSGPALYPLSLAPLGFRGCALFHDIIATQGVLTDRAGRGAFTYQLPYLTEAAGFVFYGQWVALDGLAPDGVALSGYVRALCGL